MTKLTIQSIFNRLDSNQDSEVTSADLKKFLWSLKTPGQNTFALKFAAQAKASEAIDQIDTDGDGRVSYAEVLGLVQSGLSRLPAGITPTNSAAEAESQFNKLDTSGDGHIDYSELNTALKPLATEYIDKLVEDSDNPFASLVRRPAARALVTKQAGALASAAVLKLLDENEDSTVSKREMTELLADLASQAPSE